MVIPLTRYKEFERFWGLKMFEGQRYGQAFWGYMHFHKTTDPEVEELYEATYKTAKAWIEARLDPLH